LSITVIGDVHGSLETLKALLKKIPKEDKIVFTGDLIDRGNNSKGVVQLVIDNKYQTVMGNHENMAIDAFQSFESRMCWDQNGGYNCARSYGAKSLGSLEKNTTFEMHLRWMKTLPCFLEFNHVNGDKTKNLLVSHSSICRYFSQRSNLSKAMEYDIMWDRMIPPDAIHGAFNVFGHTPVKKPVISEEDGYAFIDTGCVFGGKLTALRYPEMEIIQQENLEEGILKREVGMDL
jgi:serine/threonine protein phosphatase 1